MKIWKDNLFLIISNPPVPCPVGMYSSGGRFENCTACPAGSACPDPAGIPVACTGGKMQSQHQAQWSYYT